MPPKFNRPKPQTIALNLSSNIKNDSNLDQVASRQKPTALRSDVQSYLASLQQKRPTEPPPVKKEEERQNVKTATGPEKQSGTKETVQKTKHVLHPDFSSISSESPPSKLSIEERTVISRKTKNKKRSSTDASISSIINLQSLSDISMAEDNPLHSKTVTKQRNNTIPRSLVPTVPPRLEASSSSIKPFVFKRASSSESASIKTVTDVSSVDQAESVPEGESVLETESIRKDVEESIQESSSIAESITHSENHSEKSESEQPTIEDRDESLVASEQQNVENEYDTDFESEESGFEENGKSSSSSSDESADLGARTKTRPGSTNTAVKTTQTDAFLYPTSNSSQYAQPHFGTMALYPLNVWHQPGPSYFVPPPQLPDFLQTSSNFDTQEMLRSSLLSHLQCIKAYADLHHEQFERLNRILANRRVQKCSIKSKTAKKKNDEENEAQS